ncbi:MAG: hypothetical protein HQL97_01085 [Magnetococcales bacterium]|nr:hypothetical protein [Magnetococcales bacterium]
MAQQNAQASQCHPHPETVQSGWRTQQSLKKETTMPRQRKFTDSQEQVILIDFNGGINIEDLQDKYGVHFSTIQNILKRQGVTSFAGRFKSKQKGKGESDA